MPVVEAIAGAVGAWGGIAQNIGAKKRITQERLLQGVETRKLLIQKQIATIPVAPPALPAPIPAQTKKNNVAGIVGISIAVVLLIVTLILYLQHGKE